MMGCIKTLLNLRKQYILAAYVNLEELSPITSEYLKVWNYRKKFGGPKQQHKISRSEKKNPLRVSDLLDLLEEYRSVRDL